MSARRRRRLAALEAEAKPPAEGLRRLETLIQRASPDELMRLRELLLILRDHPDPKAEAEVVALVEAWQRRYPQA